MNDNATGRKKPLFANLVVCPASRVKLWQDKFTTRIGFRRHGSMGDS
jgi:SNF2 family DNA or RNA helicase